MSDFFRKRRLLVRRLEGRATVTGARGMFGSTKWKVRITKNGFDYEITRADGHVSAGIVSADEAGLQKIRDIIVRAEKREDGMSDTDEEGEVIDLWPYQEDDMIDRAIDAMGRSAERGEPFSLCIERALTAEEIAKLEASAAACYGIALPEDDDA